MKRNNAAHVKTPASYGLNDSFTQISTQKNILLKSGFITF